MQAQVLCLLTLALATAAAQSYNITTFAGGGPADGSPATDAIVMGGGNALAADAEGRIYFVGPNRVFQMRTDGTLAIVAGDGIPVYLTTPISVAVDPLGNVYIGEACRILKVSGGTITTIAGSDSCAANASIGYPRALAVAPDGTIYFGTLEVPSTYSAVYKISAGIISQVTAGQVDSLAVDAAGNLYGAQASLNRVVKITADGLIPIVTSLNGPTGIAMDATGNLYISDTGNKRVVEFSGGAITTVVGPGAPLSYPGALALGPSGNLYITDSGHVLKVANGIVTTVAGAGSASPLGDGEAPTAAQLAPSDVAVDRAGNVYVISGDRVRRVSGGVITTVAGGGTLEGQGADGGPATKAYLNPTGIAVDAGGSLYIANYTGLRKVSGGIIITIAGPDTTPRGNYTVDRGAYSVAIDSAGNVYYTDLASFDWAQSSVLWMLAGGKVTQLTSMLGGAARVAVDAAGTVYLATTDGKILKFSGGTLTTLATTAKGPEGIAVDASGNVYFSENNLVRKFANGVVTTIAGDGTSGFSGDGGPAIVAEMREPEGVAVDATGNIYIADSGNLRVRELTPTSTIAVKFVPNPPGRTIVIDGATYMAPHLFNWNAGDQHTVSVPNPQPIDNASRYFFAGWSDGQPASHTITVPTAAAVYTASFTTQYLLNAIALPAPNGVILEQPSSPDGYYNSGTSVILAATPNPGAQFADWFGDLAGAANPQTIIMNGPHSVMASLTPVPQPTNVQAAPDGMFVFTFTHPSGWQSLTVVDVLVNNVLDPRHACYIAYQPPVQTLFLIDDAGDPDSQYAGAVTLGSTATVQNSQCAVGLVSATGSGNTLTLTLSIAFQPAFGGAKVFYLAAQDTAQNHSDWQPLGVWLVPYTTAGPVSVSLANPSQIVSAAGTPQSVTITMTDTRGVNYPPLFQLLIQNGIDGRHACFFEVGKNSLRLADDAGLGGYAGYLTLDGSDSTIENSQCKLSAAGSSVVVAGNTVTATLNITPKAAFAGNRIVYFLGLPLPIPVATWAIQ